VETHERGLSSRDIKALFADTVPFSSGGERGHAAATGNTTFASRDLSESLGGFISGNCASMVERLFGTGAPRSSRIPSATLPHSN